jgi:hypothetical protein
MRHKNPYHKGIVVATAIVTGLFLNSCEKECITNEYTIVDQSDSEVNVSGDTLFIDGDTVLLNSPQVNVMSYNSSGEQVNVHEDGSTWTVEDAWLTMQTNPLEPYDRVIVIMQFTLTRNGPCSQPLNLDAGVLLSDNVFALPGSPNTVDVAASLELTETWNADEPTKTITRIGTFDSGLSGWPTPLFRPFTRVWSAVCGANQVNYCTFTARSVTLLHLPYMD